MRDFSKNTTNYMTLGANAISPLLSGAAQISFHFWVNADTSLGSSSSNNCLLSILSSGASTGGIRIYWDKGDGDVIEAQVRDISAPATRDIIGSLPLAYGVKVSIGVVIDYPGDTVELYVNGVSDGGPQAATFADSTYAPGTPTGQDTIGAFGTPPSFPGVQFAGLIGEIAIWRSNIGAAGFAKLAEGYGALEIDDDNPPVFFMPLDGRSSPEVDVIAGKLGTITGSIPSVSNPVYVVEADFDRDGDYLDANEDISTYVESVETELGRDKPDPFTGRAGPGRMSLTLDNRTGIFSPMRAAGALYGSLRRGTPIRWRMTSPVHSIRWTGECRRFVPTSGPEPKASLQCQTVLGREKRVFAPAAADGELPGNIIHTILDAVGQDPTKRLIDTGFSATSNWHVDGPYLLQAAREIEDTELGFLYDDRFGNVVFEDRHHRFGAVSKATLSDTPAAVLPYVEGTAIDSGEDDVCNDISASVTTYLADVASIFIGDPAWILPYVPFTLAPGESRTLTARAPTRAAFVNWFAPDPFSGTFFSSLNDVEVSGISPSDIGVSIDPFAMSCDITLTNNDPSNTATVTYVRARGVIYIIDQTTEAHGVDTTSQDDYGPKTYPFQSKWARSFTDVQNYVDYVLDQTSLPRPRAMVPVMANVNFPAYLDLHISDLISFEADDLFTKFGVDADYFIESVRESVRDISAPVHEITYGLSLTTTVTGLFTLDTSLLDSADVLVY